MRPYYSLKHALKLARWQSRRVVVALRWGPGELGRAPAVLGNAMPKSGSHLIIQVLQGLTRLGPFVNPGFPPLNRDEANERQSEAALLAAIRSMRPGDIAYGYVKAREPFISTLAQPGRATVFVYRDPRDMLVSHVFYATEIHTGHGMHGYYTKKLDSMEARLNAAITGVDEPGSQIIGVRERYAGYLGWLEQPEVLCLRFEELILDRERALGCLLDYLAQRGFTPRVSRAQAVAVLQEAIQPKKSGTFRKGKPGNWREHFTESNKAVFKERAGDLLARLGYEADNAW
jgi:hypothetical protein